MGKNKLEVDNEVLNNIHSKLESITKLNTKNIPSQIGNTNLSKIMEYSQEVEKFNKKQNELKSLVDSLPEMLYNVNDGFVQYDLQSKEYIEQQY